MLCMCGCGQETKLCTKTNKPQGRIKGLPNNFIHGHNKSFFGKVGQMRDENFVLVPAGFRERKSWLPSFDVSLKSAEDIAAEEQAVEQRAAEEENFQRRKQEAEEEYYAKKRGRKNDGDSQT
jgi:hypothetical protein